MNTLIFFLFLVSGASLSASAAADGTCSGTYPSYWQDPASKFDRMWEGQLVTNIPPKTWTGPVFQLSDRFPSKFTPESVQEQPWREARFDAMFDPAISQSKKTELAEEYIWAVMRYIQAGNIDSGDVSTDWTLCDNKVRGWYNMPFQTYDAMTGREFVHGLTREAPVSFNVKDPGNPQASITINGSMWAVGFYNEAGAYTLGKVWKSDGKAQVPTDSISFPEGTVVGKLLFNTSRPAQLPMLENMPAWQANLSDPAFCSCKASSGESACTMVEQSQQCPRSTSFWEPVRLLQFDVAIKDLRAPGTGWVFGTFVADGQRKASESNPWNRISPLGLMWGNDTPPIGQLAHDYPPNPRNNGFAEEVIFWDAADMLNAAGGEIAALRPGHLGCNSRLNGPADNANSACMSCHMSASVVDANGSTPPIIAQFQSAPPITQECVTPDPDFPFQGTDASGKAARQIYATFAQLDQLFFANTGAGVPINMSVNGYNILRSTDGKPRPQYASGRDAWISLDYSLQLSISLVQWQEWQEDLKSKDSLDTRRFESVLPAR